MRKLIMLLPLLALLCGCAPVPAVPAETVPAVTETNAAPAEPAAQEVSCISDPGHLLTQEENAQLSAAIEELSARQMIRAALVLTQDLGGSTPEAYAAAQYAAMCGAGNDGFLVLVNDATGQDLIYTEGIAHRTSDPGACGRSLCGRCGSAFAGCTADAGACLRPQRRT